jgi:hypothetical protein
MSEVKLRVLGAPVAVEFGLLDRLMQVYGGVVEGNALVLRFQVQVKTQGDKTGVYSPMLHKRKAESFLYLGLRGPQAPGGWVRRWKINAEQLTKLTSQHLEVAGEVTVGSEVWLEANWHPQRGVAITAATEGQPRTGTQGKT